MRSFQRFRQLFLFGSIAFLLAAGHVEAQAPKFDVFAGYSHATDSGIGGWEAALNVKVLPFVGVEGDVSGYGYGGPSTSYRLYLYLFGPRVTVGAGKVKIFAHALGGRLQHSGGISPDGGFLYALGGGGDFPVISKLKWRVSGDYLSAPEVSNNASGTGRFSTGPVLRF